MKYLVEIGYYDFLFEDSEIALDFMGLAASSIKDKEVSVRMTIIMGKEENDG